MKSYFTEAEYAQLLLSMDKSKPLAIAHVSQTQFSIARYSMGCTYNGSTYVYMPETDELIREDVLKAVNAMRRKEKKEQKEEVQEALL